MNKFMFFSIFLFFLILGCGAGVIKRSDTVPKLENYTDPFEYGDEFLNINREIGKQKKITKTIENFDADKKNVSKNSDISVILNTESVQDTLSQKTGYRVQVGIYDDKDEAEKAAGFVREKFNLQVFIEYSTPFFRVKAGDFLKKEDAEAFVKNFRIEGFSDARWVPKNNNESQ